MAEGDNGVAVLEEPNGAVTVELLPPSVLADALPVRIERAGIYATDLHLYEGETAGIGLRTSLVHESVRTIERAGASSSRSKVQPTKPVQEVRF